MSRDSQSVFDRLTSAPCSAATAKDLFVKMDTAGKIAPCAVADVLTRCGISKSSGAVDGDQVSYLPRGGGCETSVAAAGTCTVGSTVIISGTPGKIVDGTTNPVGVCTQGAGNGGLATIIPF